MRPLIPPAWEGTHSKPPTSPQQQCSNLLKLSVDLTFVVAIFLLFYLSLPFLGFAWPSSHCSRYFQAWALSFLSSNAFSLLPTWPPLAIRIQFEPWHLSIYLFIYKSDVLTKQKRGDLLSGHQKSKIKRPQDQKNLSTLTQIKLCTTDEKGLKCGKLH